MWDIIICLVVFQLMVVPCRGPFDQPAYVRLDSSMIELCTLINPMCTLAPLASGVAGKASCIEGSDFFLVMGLVLK